MLTNKYHIWLKDSEQQQAAEVHSWLRHACYISGTPGLTTSCPHSSPVRSHEETTVAKHAFNRCRYNRCTEDFLKRAVQDGELCSLLHSFPRICREASALLTYEAQVVLRCYWQRHLAGNLCKQVPSDYSGGHGLMVIPARDYLRFSIQGQKQGLLVHWRLQLTKLYSVFWMLQHVFSVVRRSLIVDCPSLCMSTFIGSMFQSE